MKNKNWSFILILVIVMTVSSGGTYLFIKVQPSSLWLPMRTVTGLDWLKMNHSERLFFTLGFNNGHREGIQETCSRIYELTGRPDPDDPETLAYQCQTHGLTMEENVGHVVEQITTFYEGNPENKTYVVVGLIRDFTKGMTIEEFLARKSNDTTRD